MLRVCGAQRFSIGKMMIVLPSHFEQQLLFGKRLFAQYFVLILNNLLVFCNLCQCLHVVLNYFGKLVAILFYHGVHLFEHFVRAINLISGLSKLLVDVSDGLCIRNTIQEPLLAACCLSRNAFSLHTELKNRFVSLPLLVGHVPNFGFECFALLIFLLQQIMQILAHFFVAEKLVNLHIHISFEFFERGICACHALNNFPFGIFHLGLLLFSFFNPSMECLVVFTQSMQLLNMQLFLFSFCSEQVIVATQ
mmetsp:Transcript_4140/g.15601  ORF Transcript_4140/g.15601 Transcript_4140/m.15601 type:complete len:250 (-) Transcript_4140:1377-2126(-)